MFDFRLKVFDTVAKRLNFTKAANELNITQPAVTKHIKEIELNLNIKLFERNGTKIKLTKAGEILLKYTEEIFSVYQKIEFEIGQLQEKQKGILRLGASTTIAQYVLPPILAEFRKRFPEIQLSLVIQNSERIEELLGNHKIDVGLIEAQIKNRTFHYFPFMKDEIVLVSRQNHSIFTKNNIKLDDLKNIPLVFREPGSGTLETIDLALKSKNIKLNELNIEIQLGSTESIKSYVLHSDALAFLSIQSILQELKNQTLTIIDIKNLVIERNFNFIIPEGDQSKLVNLFINFCNSYNLK
ncbi:MULTISPECIES: LysR family transcriptional regulator [Empedobacter]|uniref:CysJI operon transcriptional activator n=1 Tax=Empedobacter falsenii TaxID=343874 RepID=A0A376G5W8_9FLAO|nr:MULTISPECIES: LysR family transcriptional regulator [Empedobacter]MDH1601849.1 LysR substrate-binding domain-containing protein [Empedobacter sp. GD03739]STD56075.1 CysJI operon transcriptional activator [Empedobacter falsenii]